MTLQQHFPDRKCISQESELPKHARKLYRLLLLEDDLEVAGKLLIALHRIEPHLAPYGLDVTHLSTSTSVEQLVNTRPEQIYDAVLMDRDCKAGGSFHCVNFSRARPDRIISISSTPAWNHEAKQNGVIHIVPKSFNDLDGFATRAASKVLELLMSQDTRFL